MILYLFLLISSGILAYNIVYSDLAFYVKKALFLDKYYPQVELLSSWKFYPKFLGKYLYLLFPFCLMILTISNLHRFLYSMFQCAHCTSFWTGIVSGLFFGFPITLLIITGFLSMMTCAIYSKLRD